MAKMCPLDGCKATPGMCVHDKMMIAMMLVGAAGAMAHWGLHLF